MVFELKEGEKILADVGVNLFRGIEAVGGRMKITNRRILFEAHAINLQKMPAEIPLDQIAEIRERNTLGIVPNGILIGGGETCAEELYFWVGPAGVRRGYHVLLVDLPGQGMTPFEGLFFRTNTESANSVGRRLYAKPKRGRLRTISDIWHQWRRIYGLACCAI